MRATGLLVALVLLTAPVPRAAQGVLAQADHLVYATPDLQLGIDEIKAPRLTTWVAKGKALDKFAADAKAHGVDLGAVIPGSRTRPDGVVLSWTYTDPRVGLADRLVPYLIDWGASPHPSATAAKGVTLLSLRAEHPDADRVQAMLKQLGLDLAVTRGPKPSLIATFNSPKGRVQIRS